MRLERVDKGVIVGAVAQCACDPKRAFKAARIADGSLQCQDAVELSAVHGQPNACTTTTRCLIATSPRRKNYCQCPLTWLRCSLGPNLDVKVAAFIKPMPATYNGCVEKSPMITPVRASTFESPKTILLNPAALAKGLLPERHEVRYHSRVVGHGLKIGCPSWFSFRITCSHRLCFLVFFVVVTASWQDTQLEC